MTDATRDKTNEVIDSSDALITAMAAHSDELASTKSAVNRLNETIEHLRAEIADLRRKLPDH